MPNLLESVSPVSRNIAIAAILFFAGLCIGSYREINTYNAFLNDFKPVRQTDDPYTLVAPLVGIDSPSALLVGHYANMNQHLQDYAAQNHSGVDSYALYYRDMNSSRWFGINEDEKYIPASLLKMAIALVTLKEEEANPQLANSRRTYTTDIARINTSTPFLEPSWLVVGKAYSTQELLQKMIIDSDNGAKDLLFSTIDTSYLFTLFRLLGVTEPTDVSTYRVSPKDYALFLRLLYGGTYLTSADSERLLEMLAQGTFKDGLVAGVPGDVTVAHKFGTFTLADSGGVKTGIELHDCGIIYHRESPYILCIMTKGQDPQKLAQFISGLSSVVYQDIDAHAN